MVCPYDVGLAILLSIQYKVYLNISNQLQQNMPNSQKSASDLQTGMIWAVVAYAFWGSMPLYVWLVRSVEPLEILSHRVVWSAVLMLCIVHFQKKWNLVKQVFSTPGVLFGLMGSSILVGINWGIYIYAAANSQVLQTSLGYFFLPLLSILFGMILFKEKLRLMQWVALGIATLAIGLRIHLEGSLPWISLGVAFSFCFYGVFRKIIPVDASVGLFFETMFLLPLAGAALVYWWLEGTNDFGHTWHMDSSLALSGIVTVIPLYCFGMAARLVPLSVMGFMQYFSPCIQMVLGIYLFNESFSQEKQASFYLIWVALAVFSFDSYYQSQLARKKE
jgi:chloramphenicol-sensitive protein RarD